MPILRPSTSYTGLADRFLAIAGSEVHLQRELNDAAVRATLPAVRAHGLSECCQKRRCRWGAIRRVGSDHCGWLKRLKISPRNRKLKFSFEGIGEKFFSRPVSTSQGARPAPVSFARAAEGQKRNTGRPRAGAISAKNGNNGLFCSRIELNQDAKALNQNDINGRSVSIVEQHN